MEKHLNIYNIMEYVLTVHIRANAVVRTKDPGTLIMLINSYYVDDPFEDDYIDYD